MSRLLVEGFKGTKPVNAAAILDPTEATVAENVRIQGGKVSALNSDSTVVAKTVTGVLKSLYQYSTGDWFEWDIDVDVVTTQIGEDAWDRRIFTGDGSPKVTYGAIATSGVGPYPAASYLLGVPPPGYVITSWPIGQKPTAVVTGIPDDADDLVETRVYVVTSVDVFGAEGPPGLVSNGVDLRPGQGVDVTIPPMPVGNYNIASWRLYRTTTGSSASDFQYVGAGTTWSAPFSDAVASENLGEVLTTADYNLPHKDMIGVTAMPGAYLAGHYQNILFFSEPGFPHAWPIAYQLNTKTDIVGIEVVGQNTMLVTTTDKPYIATGTDPSSMSLSELDNVLQACVAKRSVVDIGVGAVYASPDGLMLVTTGGTTVITEGIFSREQWQAMKPESMECHVWEGLCLVSWDLGTGSTGTFIINPKQPAAGIVTLTDHPDGSWYDPLTDKLYMSLGGSIVVFGGDAANFRAARWVSKEHEFMAPTKFSAGRLWGNALGTATLALSSAIAPDFSSQVVSGDAPFRVPGAQKARDLTFTLSFTGNKQVHRFELASTMGELRRGS